MSTLVPAAVLAPVNASVAIAAPAPTTTTSSGGTGSSLCPNKQSPPAAEDDSENPSPDSAPPTPLPVPSDPVGGEQLGNCGFVLPADATAKAPPSDVNAASWVLADLDTGQVLAAKGPHARQRPAALVKVLLAMVVLGELKPDTQVLATAEDVQAARSGATVGIVPGARYTADQLVRAMLLKPGADVPNALARALGGVPKTVQKMDALAKQMGALDTRVATPSGLDGPGMSTSAYDLALIYRHAMQLPAFAEAQTAKTVLLGGVSVRNPDPLLTSYTGATAATTSNTTNAHWTNLSAATRGGHRLVSVMLRAEVDQGQPYRQAGKLLDYGFSLKDANVHPVGQLVDQAPPQPQPSESATKTSAAGETASREEAEGSGPMYAAFGNVGMPLTAVAGVFLLAALAMYLRKKRAKAARAARTRMS